MPLSDDVIVTLHMAQEVHGKKYDGETIDNLGHQKKINYALNQLTKEAFIKAVEQMDWPPSGFIASLKCTWTKDIPHSMKYWIKAWPLWDPLAFELVAESSGAVLPDARTAAEFYPGFIPQSQNTVWGDFAPWVGALIVDVTQPILPWLQHPEMKKRLWPGPAELDR